MGCNILDNIQKNPLNLLFKIAISNRTNTSNNSFYTPNVLRVSHEGLGELEKAVETLACSLCYHSISRSPKLSLVFL